MAELTQGSHRIDPFDRLVAKQRKLVEERDALISEIQGSPVLEGFLKTPYSPLFVILPRVALSSLSIIAYDALTSLSLTLGNTNTLYVMCSKTPMSLLGESVIETPSVGRIREIACLVVPDRDVSLLFTSPRDGTNTT